MASLTNTQVQFRRTIVVLFVGSIIFYSLRFGFNQSVNAYRYFFPKKVPPPESKYGSLPQLRMTSIKIGGNPQYVLDTPDGKLPVFPDRINVYEIPEPRSTLLAEQSIKNLATDFGFSNNFQKKSASEFVWVDGTNNRNYAADAVTSNFQLGTSIDKLNTVVNAALAITTTDAIDEVSGLIRSKSLLGTKDIPNLTFTTTPALVSLGRIRESKLDTQRAKMMRVDVFKKLVVQEASERNKTPEISYKIYGPNPRNSLMNFYVTNSQAPFKFPIINFIQWSVNYEGFSAYFISPIENVWTTVAENKGVISYLRVDGEDAFDPFRNDLQVNRVDIKNVSLAYFEPREYQPYLQPMYVFEGRFVTQPLSGQLAQQGDIIIYYPAIRGDYVLSGN